MKMEKISAMEEGPEKDQAMHDLEVDENFVICIQNFVNDSYFSLLACYNEENANRACYSILIHCFYFY